MKKLKINVVGRGVFGSFLLKEFSKFAQQDSRADIVFLAVPFADYRKAAEEYQRKHLINICSIQEIPTNICVNYSERVTSIHPMFGPNSPKEGRTAIATRSMIYSREVEQLFEKIGCKILRMEPADHDKLMAKTHLPVVLFGQMAREIVDRVSDVSDDYLPTSFKRLRALVEQMKDMSPGTLASIKANPYW